MLIAGLIFLALAAVAVAFAWSEHREHQQLGSVETSTCGQLRQLADAASVSGGPGAFRQRCELAGTAQPAQIGTVKAPTTGQEAVWYRTVITEEYWDYKHQDDDNPGRERSRERRVVKEDVSDVPFALADATGQAVVYPERADVHEPERVSNELKEDEHDRDFAALLKEFVSDRETIGFRTEEWIIPVGAQLFVQAEVTDEGGELRLRKPEKGTFRVSTRSEAELLESASSGRKWGSVAAVVLGVVGVVLTVLGALG